MTARDNAHGVAASAHGPTEIEVARALIVAFSEGRLAHVLGLAHRDIVWLPQARPGRSTYTGYQGTAQLMDDLRGRLGAFRVAIDECVLLPEGVVRLRGWRIQSADKALAFDLLITLRDGQVMRVDSQPVGRP